MRGFVFACVIAILGMAAPEAAAQTERMLVSGSIAGAVGTGGPAPAISVAAGFRLATHAGFETELSFIPGQDFHGAGPVVLLVFPSVPPVSFAESGRSISISVCL